MPLHARSLQVQAIRRCEVHVGFADAQSRLGARKPTPTTARPQARQSDLPADERRLVGVSASVPLAEFDAGPAWRLAVVGGDLWGSNGAGCSNAAALVLGTTGGAGSGDITGTRLSRPTA